MTLLLPIAAFVAAIATFLSFVVPDILGSITALAILAVIARVAAIGALAQKPLTIARARRRLWILIVLEGLLLAAILVGAPVEPHLEISVHGPVIAVFGFIVWLAYPVTQFYAGAGLFQEQGWLLMCGILLACAAGFWLTVLGALVWPFAVGGAFFCLGLSCIYRSKHRAAQPV
jgi:hypothetical protein